MEWSGLCDDDGAAPQGASKRFGPGAQNLDAGRIYFARADKIKPGSPAGRPAGAAAKERYEHLWREPIPSRAKRLGMGEEAQRRE